MQFIPFFLIFLYDRTSYDASRRQHWLSVYRHKFNGRFLLKQGQPKAAGISRNQLASQMKCVDTQIRAVVDQLIRQLPQKVTAKK